MVKETVNLNKLTKFLINSLLDDEIDFLLHLEEFLNLLVEQGLCKYALALSESGKLAASSSFYSAEFYDKSYKQDSQSYSIENWGELKVCGASPTSQNFWQELANHLSLYIHSATIKQRTKMISQVSSEIRRTLRPDLALEKIYTAFRDHLGITEFFFYKKLLNTEENNEDIFLGYKLFFSQSINPNDNKDINQIMQIDEISKLKDENENKNRETFTSKVRGREWGVLLVGKEKDWDDESCKIFVNFAEQIATVFSQHELHSESLTTAQREFLLNQITTKIRESLAVDSIIDTAVQEIAQVMGVESCGLVVIDQKIRGSLGHRVWSIENEYDSKKVETLYNLIKTRLEPSWSDPCIILNSRDLNAHGDLKRIKDLGIRALMICGLFDETNKELIGIVAVSFLSNDRHWTYDEQLLFEGACKQLEIALTQASIYQEAQQTKRQMALLHKLSNDIRDSLDISIVLEQIAKGIGEVLGLNRCFVRRFADNNMIVKTEEEFVSPGYKKTSDLIFGFEREWISSLAQANPSETVEEVLSISSIEKKFEQENPGLVKIAQAINLRSYLSVPLEARGKILGAITVHQCDRERVFLPEEIEFIMRVGSEAAIALEHASLFETINTFNKIDSDTGLYNKKYFRELAEKEIQKCQENKKEISLMLVDVDHLKTINDDPEHGGHEAGDEAIQILANVLSNTLRQTPVDEINKRVSDVVGRFGGDEFMVLLPNTGIEEAHRAAGRIMANLSKAKHSTWPKPLSCSIGIAGAPDNSYSYEELNHLADKALYLSKEKGRNTVSSSLEL